MNTIIIDLETFDREGQKYIGLSLSQIWTLAEAFKKTLFEKIEDEYDIAVADEAYKEYVDSGYKSTAIEDFWKELDTTQN